MCVQFRNKIFMLLNLFCYACTHAQNVVFSNEKGFVTGFVTEFVTEFVTGISQYVTGFVTRK